MKLIKKLQHGNELLKDSDYKRNGWHKATREELKDDDSLNNKDLDLSNKYWIVDNKGYLVPKSKVYEWLNSYERQLPWQEA
jgi:hypothetical protein